VLVTLNDTDLVSGSEVGPWITAAEVVIFKI